MPGVFLRKRFGFSLFLYRDIDGKCRRMWLLWPSRELVFDRV